MPQRPQRLAFVLRHGVVYNALVRVTEVTRCSSIISWKESRDLMLVVLCKWRNVIVNSQWPSR